MSVKAKSFFIGSIAFVCYMMMRNRISLRNIPFFIVACAIFAGVTLLSYCLLSKGKTNVNPIVERVWSLSAVVLLLIWMLLFYVNETDPRDALSDSALIRRYFPFPLWIGLMLLGTASCLFLLRKSPKEATLKIRRKIRLVISLLFTFGTAIQFYAPNIFQDVQGGTYHSHAYTNSIINVCWMTPYSENMETLYGHYAILFMPVVRFLHKCFKIDLLTGIFIVCACLMAVTILLFLYVLNFFVKDEPIYYLGMLAIGEEYFMLMQGGVYLQLHPHRMIFPMLLVAFALWEHKSKKSITYLQCY